MKLAFVIPGGVDRSGEVRVIPALLALFRRLALRHEVHVFALSQEAEPGRWQLAGAEIHNAGARRPLANTLRAIRSEHAREPFDLVHCIWSGKPGLLGVSAAWWLGIPSLVHVAGGELVDIPDIGYGGRRRWLGRLREAWVLRAADRVTAASAPMIASLRQLGIDAERVPLGPEPSVWRLCAPQQRDTAQPIRLIHVGSLNRVKDQVTLLAALAQIAAAGQRFHCDIVGEDTLAGTTQSLCQQLALAAQVTFHGFVPQAALQRMLGSSHLLIMSSRHEAGPLVVLEAALSGVPTVGTEVGHIAEWAPAAARAVPPRDPRRLAAAICELATDEGTRLALARAAGELAAQQTADQTAQRFQEIYRQLA